LQIKNIHIHIQLKLKLTATKAQRHQEKMRPFLEIGGKASDFCLLLEKDKQAEIQQ